MPQPWFLSGLKVGSCKHSSTYLTNGLVVGVQAIVDQVDFEEFKRRASALGAPEFMAVEIWEQMCCLQDVGAKFIDAADIETVDMREVNLDQDRLRDFANAVHAGS
jgi:hypothetical protein